jgi:hypothetical protein
MEGRKLAMGGPMPQGGKRPNAGRKPGIPNRATIERALIAERVMARATMEAKPLGKETLDMFMTEFAALAEHYRPALPGQPANPNEDEERYLKFARLAVDAASRLTPYQSPTFRAVVLAPAPESNEIKPRLFTLRIFERDQEGGQAEPIIETTSYSTSKN